MQRENTRLQSSLQSLQNHRAQQEPQQAENVAQDSNVPSGDRKMQTLMNIRQLKDIAALQVQSDLLTLKLVPRQNAGVSRCCCIEQQQCAGTRAVVPSSFHVVTQHNMKAAL